MISGSAPTAAPNGTRDAAIDAAVGLTADEVNRFLMARHAPERNAQIASINPKLPDGGSGMTNAEAAQVIADLRQGVKLTDAVHWLDDRDGFRWRLRNAPKEDAA